MTILAHETTSSTPALSSRARNILEAITTPAAARQFLAAITRDRLDRHQIDLAPIPAADFPALRRVQAALVTDDDGRNPLIGVLSDCPPEAVDHAVSELIDRYTGEAGQ